ncbi:N-acetylmuramidase domain-containing protein [Aquimarina agarivorans]|uniref:N-acetylmuramidase domain-containing protein n=1 Tax=Aquimarina agarivorans TaxID=980584 RepID=UPI000248E70E|nr:N-acetylmuramidase family protein [Aquimarina agarivorans]
MKTLRYRSRGEAVYFLEEILVKIGYNVYISNYFGKDTHAAIIDFQQKNHLVADGIVGVKTWSKLIEKEQDLVAFNDKLLAEGDIIRFAKSYNLEVAIVKAVNEIESSGKGFLVNGKPRILFEGHVFWRQLKTKGVDPLLFSDEQTKDILYAKWTKKYYKGGAGEYIRLEKAAGLSNIPAVHEAAFASASWGAFQIMGYHYESLGYESVDHFVSEMYTHERAHLKAFGKFLEVTKFKGNTLLEWARTKNWTKFAEGYNGSGFRANKYDIKLDKAYKKYVAF